MKSPLIFVLSVMSLSAFGAIAIKAIAPIFPQLTPTSMNAAAAIAISLPVVVYAVVLGLRR